jgi:hypothetical protein
MTLAAGAFRLRFSTLIFVLIRSWVDPAGARYALVWWLPAGFFARFPNLLLVTDLGVGIDSPLQVICPPCRFGR